MGTDTLSLGPSASMDAVSQVSSSAAPPMPVWRIIACAAAMCGIQVCYAAQINMGTAELLVLGVSERAVSLAWLAGPISGLIVQPIVGYASDACTSPMGRRRPFLLAGTVFTALSLILFANALPLANYVSPGQSAPRLALAIGLCAFFLLDFSIQAIQAPLRALVTDVVPRPQRAMANAYVGVFTGLGNLIGGVLTSLHLHRMLPVFPTDVQALFAIAAVVLVVTVLICVVSTPEEPLRPADIPIDEYIALAARLNYDGSPSGSTASPPSADPETTDALLMPQSVSTDMRTGMDTDAISLSAMSERNHPGWPGFISSLARVPRPFYRVFAVQLCTWSGFFTLFVYVNTWVGRNVFLGRGTAPRGTHERAVFERGVRLGGKGNALTALITLAYSLALPKLLGRFGTLAVYAFSQLVEAACLMSAPLLRGVPGQERPSDMLRLATMLDIGLFGIVWATTMGVPWTLVGNALDADPWYSQRAGLFTTLFNASQSFPQLIVAFGAPVILGWTGNDPSYVMFVGGIFAVLGAVLVVALRVDKATPSEEDDLDAQLETYG